MSKGEEERTGGNRRSREWRVCPKLGCLVKVFLSTKTIPYYAIELSLGETTPVAIVGKAGAGRVESHRWWNCGQTSSVGGGGRNGKLERLSEGDEFKMKIDWRLEERIEVLFLRRRKYYWRAEEGGVAAIYAVTGPKMDRAGRVHFCLISLGFKPLVP